MLQVYFQRCCKIWIASSNRFEFISDAQDSSSMVDNGKMTIFSIYQSEESNRFFNSHHGQKPDFNGLPVLHFGLFFRVQKQKIWNRVIFQNLVSIESQLMLLRIYSRYRSTIGITVNQRLVFSLNISLSLNINIEIWLKAWKHDAGFGIESGAEIDRIIWKRNLRKLVSFKEFMPI